jgi:hypothetical protein
MQLGREPGQGALGLDQLDAGQLVEQRGEQESVPFRVLPAHPGNLRARCGLDKRLAVEQQVEDPSALDADSLLVFGNAHQPILRHQPGDQRALHHDRVIRVVGRARTRFELGVRRGRAPLAVYASGDVLVSAWSSG